MILFIWESKERYYLKKVLLSVVLVLVLMLTVTGCGNKSTEEESKDKEFMEIKNIYKVTEQNKKIDDGTFTTLVVVADITPTEDFTMYNKTYFLTDEIYLTSASGNKILVNQLYTDKAAEATGITAGTVSAGDAESKSFIISAGETKEVIFTFFTANENVDSLDEIEFNYSFPLDLEDSTKKLTGSVKYPVSKLKSVEYFTDIK